MLTSTWCVITDFRVQTVFAISGLSEGFAARHGTVIVVVSVAGSARVGTRLLVVWV